MHWLGLVCVAGAGGITIRWLLTRIDQLGRRRAFPWISVVGLLLIGGVALTPWVLRVRLENRLSDATSDLLGADVRVHCQSFGEAFVDTGAELGFVAFGPDGVPERRTLIKREQCRHLSDYLASDKNEPSLEQVVAVHTLTHEAMHMSGLTDESATECAAVQRNARMAALLGAPLEGADSLASTYYNQVFPRMPEGYRSSDCRPGGPLDEGLPDPPW